MKVTMRNGSNIIILVVGFFGLFSFSYRKNSTSEPYVDKAANLLYNMLFCDDLELYKRNTARPYVYPFDKLYDQNSTLAELQKITRNDTVETRLKILAHNRLATKGTKVENKELLGVIVEVGMDEGLDVLATYKDGTARYINYTGSIVVWEAPDAISTQIKNDLFANSFEIVKRINRSEQPRRSHPEKGMARITFLVTDGMYFGEGPVEVLFNDPLAKPAVSNATELMAYLTGKASNQQKK
jgi:hypothetical protein